MSRSAALAGLELTMDLSRLSSNSESHLPLLPNAGIKCVHHHAWPVLLC